MQISLRRSFASDPELYDMTWAEVVKLYQAWADVPMRGRPGHKPEDLPLIAFGAFDQIDAKGAGCRRGNLNPRGLWALAYDFDDAHPDVFASVLGRAKEITSHGLVHTTWKHGLTPGVRARIIMPCFEPGQAPPGSDAHVRPEHWEALWWSVASSLGAAEPGALCTREGTGLDGQCRNVERLYYLPARNLDAPFSCVVEAWGST